MELQALTTIFRIEGGDFYTSRPEAVQQLITAQAERILPDRYVTEQEEVLQRDLQQLLGLTYDQYVAFLRPVAKKYLDDLRSKEDERIMIMNCVGLSRRFRTCVVYF